MATSPARARPALQSREVVRSEVDRDTGSEPRATILADLREALKAEMCQLHVQRSTEIARQLYQLDPVGTEREAKTAAVRATPVVALFAGVLLRVVAPRRAATRRARLLNGSPVLF